MLYRLGVEQAKEEHKMALDKQISLTHNQIEVYYSIHSSFENTHSHVMYIFIVDLLNE